MIPPSPPQLYGPSLGEVSVNGIYETTVFGIDVRPSDTIGARPPLWDFRQMARKAGVTRADRDVCQAWQQIPLVSCHDRYVREAIEYLRTLAPPLHTFSTATSLSMDAAPRQTHEGPLDFQRPQME